MSVEIIWGVVVVALSVLCWGGQCITWFAPSRAATLGLAEAEAAVEPVFWADIRGEALWDTLVLWSMVVSGVLLIVDSAAWPYFGLVGGGMYLYFAGRGILVRREMQRRNLRIGSPGSVRVGMIALAVWGAMAAVTIVASAQSLRGS